MLVNDPKHGLRHEPDQQHHPLTKREYIATHILAGLLANDDGYNTFVSLSKLSVDAADTLIQALSEKE